MSTLGAREALWSSWKFGQRERFYLLKCILGVLFEDEGKMINLDGDNTEVVVRFSYHGHVLSTEGGAQEAVSSRVRSHGENLKSFRMF